MKGRKIMKYMIIAEVNGKDYLTKVIAESAGNAEHMILDLSICGKHTYGVTACMAFDSELMKTDTFVYSAIDAEPISFEALKEIIDKRNAEIKRKDEAEDAIEAIKKQMKDLQERLELNRAILAE